jgi:hypothetical protein
MMKNKYIALCTTAALLTVAACSSSPTTLPPGQYSKTHKSTNAAGTTTEQNTETNVYVDEHGNKRAVQKTETSRDPEGLFNKSTSSKTRTYN